MDSVCIFLGFPSCTSKSSRQSTSSISVPVNEYPKSLEIKELATPIDRDSECLLFTSCLLTLKLPTISANHVQPDRLQVEIPLVKLDETRNLDGLFFSPIFTMKPCGSFIWIGVFRIFHVPSMPQCQKRISQISTEDS